MLTVTTIQATKPGPKAIRIRDGGGLFLEVTPAGARYFKQAFRYDGKQCNVTLGAFPKMKLGEARACREAIRTILFNGGDPRMQFGVRRRRTKKEDEEETVAPVAPQPTPADATWRSWVGRYLEKRKREHAAVGTIKKLSLHAARTFDVMGDKAIRDCTAQDVIAACRRYELEGKLNSAHAVRALCGQVFRFAIAHGEADFDPASPTRDAIARPQNIGYRGITEPARLGELMRALRSYTGEPVIRAALLLSAYLFPRSGEIRQMAWDQVKGDVWEVPAAAMKKNRAHTVPLPTQARQLLQWIKPLTGGGSLVLPSRSSADGQITGNALNATIRRLGFSKEEHCHHGFRIAASTNLHEMGWDTDWIERQLAHVEENKIKGAYNKAMYLPDRKRMMQVYADWLDAQEALQ